MARMALMYEASTRLTGIPSVGDIAVDAEVNNTTTPNGFDCVCTLTAVNWPPRTWTNAVPVPAPDASDAYDNALNQALDEHADFLYGVLGPLGEN